MFSLFEGAQKKFGNLLDYVAAPETNPSEQANAEETRSAEEASINTAAIAGKVLSYAKIATSAAQDKTNKLKTLMSQSAVFDNLNKQQEQFKESLNAQKEGDVPLPWEGLPNEVDVKQRFLDLSKNSNIFLEDAPVEIDAIKTEFGPLAKKLLQEDKNLEKLRYELVPKKLSEEKFWHNYLYRVSLLAKLVKEEAVNEPAEPAEQPQTSSQPSPQPTVEEPKKESQPEENVSSKDEIEQKPEKSSPSDEEDWETELLNNVDYDQVKEVANKPDNDDWENEIDELLSSCEIEK